MTTRTARDYTPYLKHAREQAARRRREAAARREQAGSSPDKWQSLLAL